MEVAVENIQMCNGAQLQTVLEMLSSSGGCEDIFSILLFIRSFHLIIIALLDNRHPGP